MRFTTTSLLIVSCIFLLSSCEFSCSVGDKDKNTATTTFLEDQPRIYNKIMMEAKKLKVQKAYLILDNGDAVPENNGVDFKNPVKMIIKIDSGWTEKDGKVMIGASEKIVTEDGTVLVDEPDLFANNTGASPEDAKTISLTASITVREGAPPTSFTVSFRIWDKNGEGQIEGNYKLYTK